MFWQIIGHIITQNLLSSGQFNVIEWVEAGVEESSHLAKPELSNCSLCVLWLVCDVWTPIKIWFSVSGPPPVDIRGGGWEGRGGIWWPGMSLSSTDSGDWTTIATVYTVYRVICSAAPLPPPPPPSRSMFVNVINWEQTPPGGVLSTGCVHWSDQVSSHHSLPTLHILILVVLNDDRQTSSLVPVFISCYADCQSVRSPLKTRQGKKSPQMFLFTSLQPFTAGICCKYF